MDNKNTSVEQSNKNLIYKNLVWTIISLCLAVLTVFVVLQETKVFSLKEVYDEICEGKTIYFIFAIICMILFIFSEGEAMRCILKKLSFRTTMEKGFFYASADIYFSAVTPSATGGQPVTLYLMTRDGLPFSVSSICLLLNLLMYNCSIVFIGILCAVFKPEIFLNHSQLAQILIVIGYVLLISLIVLFLLLLKKAEWVRSIGIFLCNLLYRFRIIKHKEKLEQRIDGMIEKYSIISDKVFDEKLLMLKVFGYNLFQRAIQITIAVFVYLGIDGKSGNIFNIWFAQAYSVIGSNCIPIPGAMGVIDYLMLEGFGQFMDTEMAAHTEIISRATNFYICIIVSLITVIIGYIRRKKKSF